MLSVNGVPFIPQSDPGSNGKNWVVLCAGSGEWLNYFVQADIYHAYQLVRSQGIPDENIIVMHIDDVAHNPSNPTPGIVVNHDNGTDVYHAVTKHYTGDHVTVKNFLGVLQSDQELVKQGKNVVNSGPNERIFVYITDTDLYSIRFGEIVITNGIVSEFKGPTLYLLSNGEKEVVLFPNNTVLHAEELNNVLKTMHTNKRFSHMVFYLGSCLAGSIFANYLPADINVYALAASRPDEYGAQYSYDYLHRAFTASYFATMWFENSQIYYPDMESLNDQYQYIADRPNLTISGWWPSGTNTTFVMDWTQHALQYGNKYIGQQLG
ncbi:unnamed protein product [Medioppia subpectinata]|uniref:Legumain n=1 Tax=Medioppia subpectinata TaxID=1979941 RepID=A0A7R9PYP7_9ACAR|nr:unnamed protein product [Medioppia subpectinata]CAG2105623.1 unnamed protein product [Medioppia subpectinata]